MTRKQGVLRSFPPVFWLVIMFEFFERGSYYGVMSILSVYLTDILHFAKQDVGLIKGTIQPLLYFLPIITGALADRFGYRRTLLVAFTLLGGGYLLTSQASSYTAVFLALCVMGLGAGAFKPIISGSIARVTDASNSTLGFGIYYWSINLGAFLFPLFLVPYLKNNVGWRWVIVAAAVGTGAMILPTLLGYREPTRSKPAEGAQRDLLETLADAFEIIYSPVVLLLAAVRRHRGAVLGVAVAGAVLVTAAGWRYAAPRSAVVAAPGATFALAGVPLEVRVLRNQSAAEPWRVSQADGGLLLEVFRPEELPKRQVELLQLLQEQGAPPVAGPELTRMVAAATVPPRLEMIEDQAARPFAVSARPDGTVEVRVADPGAYAGYRDALLERLRELPELQRLPGDTLDELFQRGRTRPFLLPFIAILLGAAFTTLLLEPRYKTASPGGRAVLVAGTLAVGGALLWGLPGLTLFARIVATIIYATVTAIYLMDLEDLTRFSDHWRFLLLIFIYSGFWVLYFQMFDSVLWYVQAYVDASSLDAAVNSVLGAVGIPVHFRFDVEHVTVINAGTIILLQLVVSAIVRKTKALPTMITGIAFATLGMAILAISTSIWVFMAGIVIFSIGEMTAHPKFISYVGQTAPRARVATYMGYVFLYGVIGSSIGGVLGANLYVHFVDNLNQPRTLWLVFSLIGVATIIGLLLYNLLVRPREVPAD